MRIEAMYNNGQLELPPGTALKHQRLKVIVDIPDQEVGTDEIPPLQVQDEENPRPAAADTALAQQLRMTLGAAYRQRPASTADADRATWLDIMEARANPCTFECKAE